MLKEYKCKEKVDLGEGVIINPGQIVQIELKDTVNNWPMVLIDNEYWDMAFEDDEFNEFFEEV